MSAKYPDSPGFREGWRILSSIWRGDGIPVRGTPARQPRPRPTRSQPSRAAAPRRQRQSDRIQRGFDRMGRQMRGRSR